MSASSHWSHAAPVKNTAPTANSCPRNWPSAKGPGAMVGNAAAKAPTVKHAEPTMKSTATHQPSLRSPHR